MVRCHHCLRCSRGAPSQAWNNHWPSPQAPHNTEDRPAERTPTQPSTRCLLLHLPSRSTFSWVRVKADGQIPLGYPRTSLDSPTPPVRHNCQPASSNQGRRLFFEVSKWESLCPFWNTVTFGKHAEDVTFFWEVTLVSSRSLVLNIIAKHKLWM